VALAVVLLLQPFALSPNAQPSHGTEGAFARGLHDREIVPGRGPQRWTGERGVFRFERLPAGPASLEVRVRGQVTPLSIRANGVEVGVIPAGRFVGRYALPEGPDHGVVVVEIVTPGFDGGDGERRGALIDRVRVLTSPPSFPPARTIAAFVIPAAVIAGTALSAGLAPAAATLVAASVSIAEALALWTDGQLYSPYAVTLARLLVFAALVAWLAARGFERLLPGSSAGAFGALFLALVVQGIAATSPVMVSSDVVFHANRLRDAAGGELFPTSVTQHATPFRIPYGVSLYALLVPLAWLGLDRVSLVTAGAGLAGVFAAAATFGLVARRDVRLATAAVVALQLLPGTFTIYSYGNLSNAFGQAVTALFFCWWSGGAPGGFVAGGLLLATAGISHLSSLIVVSVLALALVLARVSKVKGDPTRLSALALGGALVVAYYARFAGLVIPQLPRLFEGGGQGRAASLGPWDALGYQLQGIPAQFGWPALALAAVGLLVWHRSGRWRESGVERDLMLYLAAVGLLALPAVVSPLEVRYLYALGLPVAVLAAAGFQDLRARGRATALAAWLLCAAQLGLAAFVIADCVVFRYRQ
jgi:hypothetical protein